MKLLFDQNLSPKLVQRLADLFPDSMHVQSVRLDCADDDEIWEFALPPKVVWLQLGNCATAQVEAVFRDRFTDIEAFEKEPSLGTLVLS